MPTCKQMSEMATDRAEGCLGAPEREAFDLHLAGCGGCQAYVRQLEVTRQSLSRLPDPEVSPALHAALMAGFDAAAASRSPARLAPWPVLAVILSMRALLGLAQHRQDGAGDWVVAAGLAAVALVLAALAGRFRAALAVSAVGASIAAVAASGRGGGLELATGIHCLALELLAAAVVAGAAWFGVRGGGAGAVQRALAGGAVAGALAADAALQITCAAHGEVPHLLAFHVGGVLLVAAAAASFLARIRRAA